MAWNGADYAKMTLKEKAISLRCHIDCFKKKLIPPGDLKYCVASVYCRPTADSAILSKRAFERIQSVEPKLIKGIHVKNDYWKLTKVYDGDKKSPLRLRAEHVIPSAFIFKKLASEPLHSVSWYEKFIETYCNMVFITYAEDEALTKAKLRSEMPEGWTFKDGSPWARYEAIGIEIANLPSLDSPRSM